MNQRVTVLHMHSSSREVTTGKVPASALPRRQTLVPTSEKTPAPWRHTLEKPADDGSDAAEFVPFPLRLAWAMTIHKTHGLTLSIHGI